MNHPTEMDVTFRVINSFEMAVPPDYNRNTLLADFKQSNRTDFSRWDDRINDANYSNPSFALISGQRFCVDMLMVRQEKRSFSETALSAVIANGGVLVGAQGLALAFKQQGKSLMYRKGMLRHARYLSYDVQSRLPVIADNHGVPIVVAFTDGVFDLRLAEFELDEYVENTIVLSFRQIGNVHGYQ